MGTATHCPYCALQCAQRLTPTPQGRVPVRVEARDFPTNRGGMCAKGWTSAEVLGAPDRLLHPQVRRNGVLERVTWDEALDLVAANLLALRRKFGPDSVAVFGGGGLTNEKAYLLGKFARVALGTRLIDYNGRFCMSSAAAAANRAFGMDRGLGFPLSDLGGADAVLILGSNVAVTMPPLVQHLARVRERGGLIYVDPRDTATAQLTRDGAGIHLANVPGTDLAVLLALLHICIEDNLVDEAYLAARTTGWTQVKVAVSRWWPERAESYCGIAATELRRVAHALAAASPSRGGAGAYILTGRGLEQSAHGTDAVTAAINLALALGLVGRVGSGYGAITGQGNGQGGREHGQKCDQLPGYSSITDPARRAHVAKVWHVRPESLPGPGVPAIELLKSLGTTGGPRALLVHGSNPVVSAPDADAVRAGLSRLDLLVVADMVPSETAAIADVVLPVTQWAEEDGTMTNLEGRVIRRRKAVDAPGEARSELWIMTELARRLGHGQRFTDNPADVFAELARASAGGVADYSGISYERLDGGGSGGGISGTEGDVIEGEGIHWPCPSPRHPGTPRVLIDRFATPDGRARMVPVDHRAPVDDVRDDAPVYLVTGRVLTQYQSGAQTRRVAELVATEPEPFVEVHPLLALRHGIRAGDNVAVTSTRGTAVGAARISTSIRPDTVFMPFHWPGDGSANLATNDATDPISGMPEFKACAVSVRRMDGVSA